CPPRYGRPSLSVGVPSGRKRRFPPRPTLGLRGLPDRPLFGVFKCYSKFRELIANFIRQVKLLRRSQILTQRNQQFNEWRCFLWFVVVASRKVEAEDIAKLIELRSRIFNGY